MHGLGLVLDLTLTLHTNFDRFFLSLNLFLGSDTFCSSLLDGLILWSLCGLPAWLARIGVVALCVALWIR